MDEERQRDRQTESETDTDRQTYSFCKTVRDGVERGWVGRGCLIISLRNVTTKQMYQLFCLVP